eukprot:gene750-814_t
MYLRLERLQAKDLVDTSTPADSQDPGLILKVGSEEHETSRVKHAGMNADFIETYDIEVDPKGYSDGSLEIAVEVINRGYGGKQLVHIGIGKASLKSLVPTLDKATAISIDLIHYSKSANVKQGKVLMLATLSDTRYSDREVEPVAMQKLGDDAKSEMIAQTFGDVGELIDDFHCGYTGSKMVYYGRLYVTTHYICFSSKLFGKEVTVRIPFHHIKSITRTVDHFFKLKAILLIDAGKIYRFHSFWDFDQSLRNLNKALDSYRDRANGNLTDEENRLRSTSSQSSNGEVIDEQASSTSVRLSSDFDLAEVLKTESEKCRYKITVISQQTLPVSIDTFAKLFIDDNAPFSYKLYHESVKDTDVVMSCWQTVGGSLEMSRDLKFFKPVNLPGLASTRGVKLQNYKRFGDVGLLLCSSTHLEDVPAADCFSVDDCMEVGASGPDAVKVTITFQVTFVKSTLMKTFIESPTNSEMKKWLAAYFEHLQKNCTKYKPALIEMTVDNKSEESAKAAPSVATPSPSPSPPPQKIEYANSTLPLNGNLKVLEDHLPLAALILGAVFLLLILLLIFCVFLLTREVHSLTLSVLRAEKLLNSLVSSTTSISAQ